MIPLASQPRPDEQVAAGYLDITLAGQVRRLPVLPIVHNREWTAQFQKATDTVLGRIGTIETLADVAGQLDANVDVMLDLLVAYDRSGVLGGREYMEHNASAREVYDALKAVTEAAFPFGADLLSKVPAIRSTLMLALAQEVRSPTSTSGRPRSTAGRRKTSKSA